jgi:hypothetical protein
MVRDPEGEMLLCIHRDQSYWLTAGATTVVAVVPSEEGSGSGVSEARVRGLEARMAALEEQVATFS